MKKRPTAGHAPASRLGIGAALVLEVLLFALLSPHFLTAENLLNVTLQTSITAIIAAGMTLVILTGGIDLSVGSLVAMVGVVGALVARSTPAPEAAVGGALAAGLVLGALSGLVAGLLITRFSISPFIATLALMTIWRGLAFIVTEGRPVWELPESFAVPGGGRFLGVPIPTMLMAGVFVTTHLVLTRTRFGRHVYAVGGNAEAARLAGISTGRVTVAVYVIGGILTALSGVLLASRLSSGQPNAGLMYELDVIAAVVVGGASLTGGRGSVAGTFLGSMLIGILRNGLNLLDIGSYVQQVIVGVVILLAVVLDRWRTGRS
jgi:ribose transport system permease protein